MSPLQALKLAATSASGGAEELILALSRSLSLSVDRKEGVMAEASWEVAFVSPVAVCVGVTGEMGPMEVAMLLLVLAAPSDLLEEAAAPLPEATMGEEGPDLVEVVGEEGRCAVGRWRERMPARPAMTEDEEGRRRRRRRSR
jgi:hypothetical protein